MTKKKTLKKRFTERKFKACYEVFYGEQKRYEEEIIEAKDKDNAYRKALIYEINKNISRHKDISKDEEIIEIIGKDKDINYIWKMFDGILQDMSTGDLDSFAQEHKQDRAEYEIWDLQGVEEDKKTEAEINPNEEITPDYENINLEDYVCMHCGQDYSKLMKALSDEGDIVILCEFCGKWFIISTTDDQLTSKTESKLGETTK